MKKCYAILFISCIIFCNTVIAQQPYVTQFHANPMLFNPAFTGNAYHLNIRAHYKTMWTDLENPPATAMVSGHTPIGISSSSIGAIVMQDEIGITTNTSAALNYAYRFQTKIGQIATGATLQFSNYREQLTATKPAMPNDPLLAADYNTMLFNAGLGVAWENDKGYAGIAVPSLLNPTRSGDANDTIAIVPMQINITGMYQFPLSASWTLSPAMHFSYIDNLPTQLAVLFLFEWDNALGLLAGYRSNNAYSAGIHYRFMENFLIGYSYDYFASGIGIAGGGHELTIGFDLNKPEGE